MTLSACSEDKARVAAPFLQLVRAGVVSALIATAGFGSDKMQEAPPVSVTDFGVNGGVIEGVPPISHRI